MKLGFRPYQVMPSKKMGMSTVYRPAVRIRVVGSTGSASVLALVDTGSDQTLFPYSVGRVIGAVDGSSDRLSIGGINRQNIEVTMGDVELELTDGQEKYRWLANVGFVMFASPEDEVAILSHQGCLEYFTVIFDGAKRELEMVANKKLALTK